MVAASRKGGVNLGVLALIMVETGLYKGLDVVMQNRALARFDREIAPKV